jgi:hypothetical protein
VKSVNGVVDEYGRFVWDSTSSDVTVALRHKLGMEIGQRGDLLFIPKGAKGEGAVEKLLGYLEGTDLCLHSKVLALVAAVRAELALRGEETVVEVSLRGTSSTDSILSVLGQPGRYAIRRLPDAPKPKAIFWRRPRAGFVQFWCSECGYSMEGFRPVRCGGCFAEGEVRDLPKEGDDGRD